MAAEDPVVTQLGLLLTQMRYSRAALEQVERATTKYAGIALSLPGGGSGGPLGAPPLIDGALKVYVVNIGDLTSGGGVGDVIAGALGGAGRFLGGLFGGVVGGTISSITFAWLIHSMRGIVEALDRMLARIGTKPEEDKPKSAEQAAADKRRTPTIVEQLGSIAETLRAAALAFSTASAAPALPGVVADAGAAAAAPATSTYLDLVRGVGGVVDGLNILLPNLTGSLAALLVRIDDIKIAIVDLLQFAVRCMLLLWYTVMGIVREALPMIGDFVVKLIGIVGDAVVMVILAAEKVVSSGLKASLTALDVAGTGLKATVDPLMVWLVQGLGKSLAFLGDLKLFRVLAHLANVLPLVLPVIARLAGKALSGKETDALVTASKMELPKPSATAAEIPGLPNVGIGKAGRDALMAEVLQATSDSVASYRAGERAVKQAGADIATATSTLAGKLDTQLTEKMLAGGDTARALSKSLEIGQDMHKARPESRLDSVAKAYEAWLAGGGLVVIGRALEQHIATPPDGVLTRAVAADVAARGAGTDFVAIEIDEVTIDLKAEAQLPVGPSGTVEPIDIDAEIARSQRTFNERNGIVFA
jgi:hypothetical protein